MLQKTKKLNKTLNSKLNKNSKTSYIYKEVNPTYEIKHNCLSCSRLFNAKSKYNKVCELCKISDKWKMTW